MAAFKCPKHGMQIAVRFCEHGALAVESAQPMEVYLQQDQWGWYTVCPDCILLPRTLRDTDFLVCARCVVDWAEQTGSDYVARCQSPVEEYPGMKETRDSDEPEDPTRG